MSVALSLLSPWMLAVALLLPLAFVRRPGTRPAVRLAPLALVPALPVTTRTRLRLLPAVLRAAGLLLVVLALARPVTRTPLPLTTQGIDILLCLDVSSSMRADDMARGRTRLEVAREAAARFVEGRPQDRIGLLLFGRWPELRCPPTLDHRALADLLAAASPVASDGPEDATGIGAAAARAAEVLAAGKARSKVAVLLTDGEENVALADAPGAISPVEAAQLCERLGVRVQAIVAGSGTPRPGSPPPDFGPLRRLAERTGGAFQVAPDAAGAEEVFRRIDALETTPFERPRFETRERFAEALLAALALLLLARFLAAGPLGSHP
jgi:Ca-activated chloride channel family protein